jgi:hypothetical protein
MSEIQDNEILADCAWFADKHRGKNKQSGPYWSTIIRFPKLYDEAVRLQKRVDTLEDYIADYPVPTDTYCAYCGVRFPLDDDAAHLVSEHIRICEKHPMRLAEAEIKCLQQRIAELEQERRWIPVSERLPEEGQPDERKIIRL